MEEIIAKDIKNISPGIHFCDEYEKQKLKQF